MRASSPWYNGRCFHSVGEHISTNSTGDTRCVLYVGGVRCVQTKSGVPMESALAAINAASGRSLVTEERIPNHVLSLKFDFGFALDLMRKDISITMDTLTELDSECQCSDSSAGLPAYLTIAPSLLPSRSHAR